MASGNAFAHAACTTERPGHGKRERVQRFYDEVWTRYIPDRAASRTHLKALLPAERIVDARVLDAGCGTGVFAAAMAEGGAARVSGIDISPGALSTARASTVGLPVHLLRGSLEQLPFAAAAFDVVWAWGAVEHTEHPWTVLRELDRVLAPGGSMVLALYKRSRWTGLHGSARAVFSRLPVTAQSPLARLIALGAAPYVNRFKRREKMRQGETLKGLIHDWFFVPIRHHFVPDEVRAWLTRRGHREELYLPSTARFEVSSHFVVRTRKTACAVPPKTGT